MLRRSRFLFLLLASCSLAQARVQFSVSYPASAFKGPFTGRVVVYLTKGAGEPRFGPNWFSPEPMYSAWFTKVKPGQSMVINDRNAVGFPGKLSQLKPGDYRAQAVVDRNLGGRQIGASPGNLYSGLVTVHVGNGSSTAVLTCSKVIPQPVFRNTKHVRLFKLQSRLLTRFYHRPTYIKGAVILPDVFLANPSKPLPVIYEVPGFGGDYMRYSGRDTTQGTVRDGVPFIYVSLDPNVPTGHCVFADSANNGPWGTALTTEYIPALEKHFHGIGKPYARFVTGHSSGGWASLWLQVAYPDFFGGVWSTSPDPVDFRRFQLIDIYKQGANMFWDANGKAIPVAREGATPIIYYKPFSDMERPIRGEQLGSFEAVFSPRGADGNPHKLWNRDTGAIDPATAQAWKKYDIALKLRREWPRIGPKLRGKLHVYCGSEDTFYLDGAVRLLQAEMKDLHSDAKVELFPGNHFTVMTPELMERMDREMAAQFKSHAR